MICPNLKCGRTVIAPDGSRGKVVRCAHCQQLFMVPADRPKEKPQGGQQAEGQPAKPAGQE
jgi:predicted Zn finger-like uncharacterized protein